VAALLHARAFLPLYSLCWLVGSRIKVKLCCCMDEVLCHVPAQGLPVKPGAPMLRGCQRPAISELRRLWVLQFRRLPSLSHMRGLCEFR
jgi:hypothetical protein